MTWPFNRTQEFSTRKPVSVSGKETRIADWSYPRYTWEASFTTLRQGLVGGLTWADFATLFGFYEARQGSFDSFLYEDADDRFVSNQGIAVTDGVTRAFQLARAFGGNTVPVLAPNTVSYIFLNGVIQNPSTYQITLWGSGQPGQVIFNTVPAAGQ